MLDLTGLWTHLIRRRHANQATMSRPRATTFPAIDKRVALREAKLALNIPLTRCSKLEGSVFGLMKKEEEMPTGTVKFFNEQKGFGFIQPEGGGADAFVHISDVERSGMNTLRENDRVSYDVEDDNRGKTKATNLKMASAE